MRTKMVVMCLVGLLWLLVSFANAEVRTWTRAGGTQFDAEFVKKDHGMVTFRKADGTEFTMNMAKLSKEDRSYVVQQPKNAPPPADPPKAQPPAAMQGPAGPLKPRWSVQVHRGVPAAHVEIVFPAAQHDYAFDVSVAFSAEPINDQYRELDKQYHFAAGESTQIKRALAAAQSQLVYGGRKMVIIRPGQ